MKGKFTIQVNKQSYQVYPQFESLIEREPVSIDIAKIVDQVFEGRSIPISRRVILSHYIASVLSQAKGKTLSKEEALKVFEAAIKEFNKETESSLYKNPAT